MSERLTFTARLSAYDTGDGHVIRGLAVPWDAATSDSRRYVFARGALTPDMFTGRPLRWQHTEVLGRVEEAWTTDDGINIAARIGKHTLGRDTVALMDVLPDIGLSIGVDGISADYDDDTGHTTIHHVDGVAEVSVVDIPAFNQAKVTARMSKQEDPMTDTTTAADHSADLAAIADARVTEVFGPIRDQLLEVRERLAAIQTAPADTGTADPYRKWDSIGEFTKAVRSGDADARKLTRQVLNLSQQQRYERFVMAQNTTADIAGLTSGWRNEFIDIVYFGRPVVESAGVRALPASGPVPFARNNWDPKDGVAVQASELTDVRSIKSSVTEESVAVKTYAGGSVQSMQAIERSDPSFVSILMADMAKSYAVATELDFVSSLETDGTGTVSGSAGALLPAIREASYKVHKATGSPATGILVSDAAFLALLQDVDADGRPIWGAVGPSNAPSASAVSGAAPLSVDGVRIIPDLWGSLTTVTAIAYNGAAAQFAEDGPRMLSDDFPVDLSREYAIYGYGAPVVYRPAGVVKVTLA